MTNLPDQPALCDGQVHVWRACLPVSSAVYQSLQQTLDATERDRAARFAFEQHRVSFTFAHGVLRSLLSGYCRQHASQLRFSCGKNGKPALADETNDLRFNLSHSGDVILCAVTRQEEVGVDVECIGTGLASGDIARQFFAGEEVQALFELPPDLQLTGFFRCWTRKEAFIKARGEGLSLALKSFAVSLRPEEQARFLRIDGDQRAPAEWTLRDIDVPSGYAAAIAIAGRGWEISTHDWNDFVSARRNHEGT
jgi:4'-phosphopantetheinyl transferase